MMRKAMLLLLLALAACEVALPPPTITPTAFQSLIEASPTVNLVAPEGGQQVDPDVGANNPTAAALAPDSALPPLVIGTPAPGDAGLPVVLTAVDNTPLRGLLYQAADSVRHPGVLLLAPPGADWAGLPGALFDSQYTVLVMEVRPGAPTDDFTVMLDSLATGIADPGRLAVVGADSGADLALLGCARQPLCDAVALLSPANDTRLITAMESYGGRPALLAASEEDTLSFAAIAALRDIGSGDILFQPLQNAGRGTAMLAARPDLGALIIQWLGQSLG